MAAFTETLYIATSNPGKLRDFMSASRLSSMSVLPLPGIEDIPPPPEDADSFAGNACLKATRYSQAAPGRWVLADDSGLEVDALHGAPGIHSARFAAFAAFPNPGLLTKDLHNNAYLLDRLRGVPIEKRTARYRCFIAIARDGVLLCNRDPRAPILGMGSVEGIILTEPRGTGGFGYDPLFFLPEQNQTMAEIPVAEKLKFSHRGRALSHLAEIIACSPKLNT